MTSRRTRMPLFQNSTHRGVAPLVAGLIVAGIAGAVATAPSWVPGLAAFIAGLILKFAQLLLTVGGTVFNWALVKTVFGFSSFIGNSPSLLLAWGILRDLGNMLLLFGFIFIGLSTILDLQTYTAKKALPRLIIFAILMNFSLFAAEAVIDTSNLFSVTMYRQANTTNSCIDIPIVDLSGGQVSGSTACDIDSGLAGAMMSSTGLSTLIPDINTSAVNLLMLAVFATVGAFVFFAGAIMLMIRAVTLTFLMVTAPIGFAAMAVPPLKSLGEKWWNMLLHQSFFAPILILLIIISLKIGEGFIEGPAGNTSLAGALQQEASASYTGVYFIFFLMSGFLIGSIIVAKKFGAMGADFAINTTKKLGKGAYRGAAYLPRQGTGFVGRQTVGRLGKFTQKRYEAWLGEKGKEKEGLLRQALRFNVLGVDSALSATLTGARAAKFGGKEGFDEAQKRHQARLGRATAAAEEIGREKDLEKEVAKVRDAKLEGDTEKIAESNEKIANLLQRMSDDEIKRLDMVKYMQEGINHLGENLSPEMFDKLINDKEMPEDQKERLKQHRFEGFEKTLKNAVDNFKTFKDSGGADMAAKAAAEVAKRASRRATKKDLSLIARYQPALFKTMLEAKDASGDSILSHDQFDGLLTSNDVTEPQRAYVRDHSLPGRIETAFDSGDKAGARELVRTAMSPRMKAKFLPSRVISDPETVNELTTADLVEVATEAKLKGPARDRLANQVQARMRKGELGDLKMLLNENNPNLVAYFGGPPK